MDLALLRSLPWLRFLELGCAFAIQPDSTNDNSESEWQYFCGAVRDKTQQRLHGGLCQSFTSIDGNSVMYFGMGRTGVEEDRLLPTAPQQELYE